MFKSVFTVFLLFISLQSFSQKVIFCESVTGAGTPVNEAGEFSIGDKGGFFKILVKLNKQLEATNVVFDVYLMKDNRETLDNSLKMDVKRGLTWFYKEITFFKPGEYHVYVYDDRDQILGVGRVKIKLK